MLIYTSKILGIRNVESKIKKLQGKCLISMYKII